jgi:hypothetical protein
MTPNPVCKSDRLRPRGTLITLLAILLSGLDSFAFAQDQPAAERKWVAHRKSTGSSPLEKTKQWPLEKTKAADATTAFEELETLLSDSAAPILRVGRNYVVLVAAAGWSDMYLVKDGCYSVTGGAVRLTRTCNLKDLRIMGDRDVSVVGIKRPTASFDLTWEVAQKKRKRFDIFNFVSLLLPSVLSAVPDAAGYQYETVEDELTIVRIPVDLEVKATAVEFDPKGEKKEKAFGGTFNNYANEYFSLSVGAAVRKVDDVSLDLGANSLAAKEVSKLKTYALVDVHPVAIDPSSPAKWTLPFLTGGIEVNKEQFNYGVGIGWHLPFIKNTSIGVLMVHALPDKTADAKAKADSASNDREWKPAYIVHYIFPLPKTEKK